MFLPAGAGALTIAGFGAGSGAIGYMGDWMAHGADPAQWSWGWFAASVGVGAVTAGAGSKYASARRAAATRARVKANVAASQASRESSNFGGLVSSERNTLARGFYRDNGFLEEEIGSHVNGIDLRKPVEIVRMPEGTVLEQWQYPSGPQGNYYAWPGTDPRTIGIEMERVNRYTGELERRVATEYRVSDEVRALQSTAADFVWPNGAETKGGGVQLMTTSKSAIIPNR